MNPGAPDDHGGACACNGSINDGLPPSDALDRLPQNRQHYCRGWRRIILNLTPSWFSVNMGTGIASILLHNLPYNAVSLYWISVAVFCLNVALFLLFLAISIARYTMFPGLWTAMVNHPVQSLFLGMLATPMMLRAV